MDIPEKNTLVGIWHDHNFAYKWDWDICSKYYWGEPTGPTKVSYWATPILRYGGFDKDIRINIQKYVERGAIPVSEEEYKRRWEEKRIESEKRVMWAKLCKKP